MHVDPDLRINGKEAEYSNFFHPITYKNDEITNNGKSYRLEQFVHKFFATNRSEQDLFHISATAHKIICGNSEFPQVPRRSLTLRPDCPFSRVQLLEDTLALFKLYEFVL